MAVGVGKLGGARLGRRPEAERARRRLPFTEGTLVMKQPLQRAAHLRFIETEKVPRRKGLRQLLLVEIEQRL